ncbi:MAG: hypothetical protein IJ060_04500 [Oscillospiraceae bacterium]|nr:hypothetical protein [Oscillospiraceae bacterium]
MPKTKKTEEAVEKVKAAAETAKETVKAAAENAVEKAEVVVEKAKTAAKKVAKPRTKKADTADAAEKPARAKKAAKTEKIETKVVIELGDKSASSESLITRAKEDWTGKGNSLDEVKELALYINAAEGMVYYVVNDDYLSGSFAI